MFKHVKKAICCLLCMMMILVSGQNIMQIHAATLPTIKVTRQGASYAGNAKYWRWSESTVQGADASARYTGTLTFTATVGGGTTYVGNVTAEVKDYNGSITYTTNDKVITGTFTSVSATEIDTFLAHCWIYTDNWANPSGSMGDSISNTSTFTSISVNDGYKVTWQDPASESATGTGTVTINGSAATKNTPIDVPKGSNVTVVFTPSSDSYVSGYTIGTDTQPNSNNSPLTKTFTVNEDTIISAVFTKKESEPSATGGRPEGNLSWNSSTTTLSYKNALTFNFNAKVNSYALDSRFGKSWTYGVDPLENPKLYSTITFGTNAPIVVGSQSNLKDLGLIGAVNSSPVKGKDLNASVPVNQIKPGSVSQAVWADYYTAGSICPNHWYHVYSVEYHQDALTRTYTIEKDILNVTIPTSIVFGNTVSPVVKAGSDSVIGTQASVDNSKIGIVYKNAQGVVVTNPTDKGTYTVEISYDGDDYIQSYGTGKTNPVISKQFTITSKAVTASTVTIDNQTFDPQNPSTPTANVVVDGKTLKAGEDYDISYSDNTKPGIATATITFKGNYSGTTTKTFTIETKPVTSNDVVIDEIDKQTYTGLAVKPKPTSFQLKDGTVLKEGVDYDIQYDKNIDAGEATIKYVLKGNYVGTITKTFNIEYSPTIKVFLDKMTKGGQLITSINDQTFEDLLNSKEEYDKLTSEDKEIIDRLLTREGNTKYEDLYLESQAEDFIKKYVTGEDGTVYNKVNGKNSAQIYLGDVTDEGNWSQLPKALQDEINKRVSSKNGGVSYDDLLKDAKPLFEKGIAFIVKYVSDEDGNIYKDVTSKNYEQILLGKTTWDSYTQDEKDTVNTLLIASGGKTYEELLKGAQTLKDVSSDFIKKYVSDEDGKIYKGVSSKNYEQILLGKTTWDTYTQEQKDAINAILAANGGKTYEELLKGAQNLKGVSIDFIKKYVSDKNGNIYKDATANNYQQILSGQSTWDTYTQEQKDDINAILVANGGKTYEELLKASIALRDNVKTDDTTLLAPYAFGMLLSICSYFAIKRRKEFE